NAEAAGIEVGVAFLPTWNPERPSAPTGGGNLAVIKAGKTEQQMAAAWEFIKFVMSDEEVARNAAETGYLPATYGSVEQPIIQELWAERPEYKVAFDQLEIAQEMPWSPHNSEFIEQWKVICSQLIIDRSITPEEAVEQLKIEAQLIYR
ncbi:MAG TPA: extracellular solute-binding protein, partial [Limnochordia bacterium]|nr:extracellular solute-binding protein [Limnochordia bacterium]